MQHTVYFRLLLSRSFGDMWCGISWREREKGGEREGEREGGEREGERERGEGGTRVHVRLLIKNVQQSRSISLSARTTQVFEILQTFNHERG